MLYKTDPCLGQSGKHCRFKMYVSTLKVLRHSHNKQSCFTYLNLVFQKCFWPWNLINLSACRSFRKHSEKCQAHYCKLPSSFSRLLRGKPVTVTSSHLFLTKNEKSIWRKRVASGNIFSSKTKVSKSYNTHICMCMPMHKWTSTHTYAGPSNTPLNGPYDPNWR